MSKWNCENCKQDFEGIDKEDFPDTYDGKILCNNCWDGNG